MNVSHDIIEMLVAKDNEIARLTADLAHANERLGEAMALLGDWQAIPVRDHFHGDVAARTRAFMEPDAIELMSPIGAAAAVKEEGGGAASTYTCRK